MSEFSQTDLFTLKSKLENQLEYGFSESETAQSHGAFDFLIGEWDLVRTSFDADGELARRTKGTVVARYAFAGRVIQEDFHNFRDDGSAYRAGTALYTFNPSAKQWHVAAIDASTGATAYQPVWVAGEVRYESVVRLPDRDVFTKSRIFNIASDSTEWEQHVSIDRKEWFPNYHIINRRKHRNVW